MDGSQSPRIFAPSSLSIDDSQLCFNKNHFSRSDFDVQCFMNLTRRRAGLEQIQKDLRLYLKSVQHSMIELINDDYADFVHLSSNLVSLQASIDKIDSDLKTFWTEFETSTSQSVGTAEVVESRCDQLASNRRSQVHLRDRIAFLSGLQRLRHLINKPSSNILWLEKVASCVVDVATYAQQFDSKDDSKEALIYAEVTKKLDDILCAEGVRTAGEDCSSLPLVISILSLTKSTDSLTAALIADLLQRRFIDVNTKNSSYESLIAMFDGVFQIRENWSKTLGFRFVGQLRSFLDQTLLAFVQTFIDKSLTMVVVPSDTKLFHKCFLATMDFIGKWPTAKACRSALKSIKDKFNLVVYFKLVTYKVFKEIDANLAPEKFSVSKNTEKNLSCSVSSLILRAIENVWEENVILTPLIDKFWDYTLRLLGKHFAWAKAMRQAIVDDKMNFEGFESWQILLRVKSDLSSLHSKVFDFAIEHIWIHISNLGLETSMFGQCLTRMGALIDGENKLLEDDIVKLLSEQHRMEFDNVSDIPKQYRWTKKPLPTTASPYVNQANLFLDKIREEAMILELEVIDEILEKVQIAGMEHFVKKTTEVLNVVEATGSSLSRFKKKTETKGDGITDEDKIKAQMYLDAQLCQQMSSNNGIDVSELNSLINRLRSCTPSLTEPTNRNSPAPENVGVEESNAVKNNNETLVVVESSDKDRNSLIGNNGESYA